jgi:Gpi18-like mannosyltransferase
MPNARKPPPYAEALLLAGLVALAVLARWAGWREKTNDMNIFFQWYQQVRHAGGWRGIGSEIGNYNAPFLYLLAIVIYLPGPLILKIKAIFVLFDVVLAFFTYKIVGLRFPGRPAIVAAVGMTLLPTVVINASWYGQMDAMWACFAVGGVYFLLRERPWVAVSLCAVSLAIKPQGIFVFPLLLLLALAGRLPWRTFLAVPAVLLVLDLPALIAGRDPIELFTIYDLGRQARNVPALTLRAPSIYAFVPAGPAAGTVRTLGYIFTAAIILGICYVLIFRRIDVIASGALFAVGMPFLLPGMHERYFFLADVMTVLLAIHHRRLWPVPLLVQAASLLAYEPYLFGGRNPTMLPLVIPAALMLAALVTVGHHVLRKEPEEMPDTIEELLSRPAGARPEPLPARRA